jgi:hypothetical protein
MASATVATTAASTASPRPALWKPKVNMMARRETTNMAAEPSRLFSRPPNVVKRCSPKRMPTVAATASPKVMASTPPRIADGVFQQARTSAAKEMGNQTVPRLSGAASVDKSHRLR